MNIWSTVHSPASFGRLDAVGHCAISKDAHSQYIIGDKKSRWSVLWEQARMDAGNRGR